MTREQTVNIMNNPHPTPDMMYQWIAAWYRDYWKEDWRPQSVNINQLSREFQPAVEYYQKKHAIHLLFDRNQKLIKIF